MFICVYLRNLRPDHSGVKSRCLTQSCKARKLPFQYRDRFGRLLIAQAIVEPMKFLTADVLLHHRSVLVITVPKGRMKEYSSIKDRKSLLFCGGV